MLTRKDFMGNHEWCFYGWREGAAHVCLGPTNATDVWAIKKVNPQSMVHLTEKPVELAVAGDAVFVACRRERAGSLRRQWLDVDCGRADGPSSVPDGAGHALCRRHRPALGEVHRAEGRADRRQGGGGLNAHAGQFASIDGRWPTWARVALETQSGRRRPLTSQRLTSANVGRWVVRSACV